MKVWVILDFEKKNLHLKEKENVDKNIESKTFFFWMSLRNKIDFERI